jgi:stage II sporulation protein D
MAEPSRRPEHSRSTSHSGSPLLRGPVVILPPAGPGGRERRFAIQPGKVLGLLVLCFLLGSACTFGLLQLLTHREVERLSDKLETVEHELAALRDELVASDVVAPEPPTADESGEDTAEEGATPAQAGPRLEIPVASLGPSEPTVRVALLRTTDEILLQGEGIVLAHEQGEPTPMPRGQARIRPGVGGGIFIEGVGPVRQGTPIECRLGPIRIGDRSYPGRLEVHSENGAILLINEVSMEDYVAGVVNSEMPASWGLEARKAQAVAARSYALMRRAASDQAWHVEASVLDQVYNGKTVDPTSQAAVTATHGQVLAVDDKLVSVYYSSTCAGHSEQPRAVWPERPSHGTSMVACGFCEASPNYSWNASISPSEVLQAVRADGHKVGEIRSLRPRTSTTSGRVRAIDVVTDKDTVTWSGNEFRRRMGWGRVRSTRFELRYDQETFVLTGTGFGHGVGLCQWGAQGMDRAGRTYAEILGHYFPGAEVAQAW